ncbi:hypothetical protein BJ138DRAFT_1021132, partial [Hygrophoropsis aurantiaca]
KPVSAPTKKRGRPPKPRPAPEANVPAAPSTDFCVSIFVTVDLPPRAVKGKTSRGDKMEKRDITMEPALFTHENATWDKFLAFIAGVAKTKPSYLVVSSMGWHWNGKAKKTTLSLSNEVGLQTMVGQILASKSKGAGVIFVTMAKPRKPKTEDVVSVDRKIAPIVEELEHKYPVGICRTHPRIRCFEHAPTKLHFELDANRMKVWALAIEREKTDSNRIPIGSNFFLPKDALPVKTAPVTPNRNNATGFAPDVTTSMGPQTPYQAGHPYGAMLPSPYHGYPAPVPYGYLPQYGHPAPQPPGAFYPGYGPPMAPYFPGYPHAGANQIAHHAAGGYGHAMRNNDAADPGPSVNRRQPLPTHEQSDQDAARNYPPPPGPPPPYVQAANNQFTF